jgi:hypothetical protein
LTLGASPTTLIGNLENGAKCMTAKRSGEGKKPADRRSSPSKLIRKLLRKIVRGRAASEDKPREPAAPPPLPPAGKRTGRGASSVKPFLDQSRNTRPGPLE